MLLLHVLVSSCFHAQYFLDLGFNAFRIPFTLERLVPPAGGLTGPFDKYYLGNLTSVCNFRFLFKSHSDGTSCIQLVEYITENGGYAIVDRKN